MIRTEKTRLRVGRSEEKEVSEACGWRTSEKIVTLEALCRRVVRIRRLIFTGDDMGSDKAMDNQVALYC